MKRLSRRLLTIVLLAAVLIPVSTAYAMTNAEVTLNEQSGGQPARFNLTAVTDTDASIDSLTLTFPQGFEAADSHSKVTTLKGLQRTAVNVTESHEGRSFKMSFSPAIAPGSNLSLYVYDVMLPAKGGEFTLGATYVANGQTRSVPAKGLGFSFDSVPPSQALASRLDRSPAVKAWNSVGFFNLFLKPQLIVVSIPLVFVGWLTSIGLVAFAFPLAIVGGLMLAFMKMSKLWIVRAPAGIYINVIRGTPLFLQIYIGFIGLPIAGIHAPWYVTGVIVLALNSSAYLAEIFRAGTQSISKGQFEASSSLGMTYAQSMQYVIVPQTVKRVLPTMTSEFILLFKDTALLSAVGVFELMLLSNSKVAQSGNLTPFVVAAVYYLIVTIPLINWVASLEARLAISEGGQAPAEQKPSMVRRFFGAGGRAVTLDPMVPSADKDKV